MMDLEDRRSSIIEDRRSSIASSFEELQLETTPLTRSIPKGSDVFQKTLNQVYDDMQKERTNRRLLKENGEEEEDEFSDEERDKCTDFQRFRRFSQDFSAKQHHFARAASLKHVQSGQQNKPFVPGISLESPRNTGQLNGKMKRRHSIATVPFGNMNTNVLNS